MTIQDQVSEQDAHNKIVAAINQGWPGAQWSLSGSDVSTLQWLDASPAPTVDQLNSAVAALPSQQTVLSQDLMAQFTTADLTKIKAAVDGSIQFWGMWSALQAQSAPMIITNERFIAGWAALTQVLTQDRMSAIATALGVTI